MLQTLWSEARGGLPNRASRLASFLIARRTVSRVGRIRRTADSQIQSSDVSATVVAARVCVFQEKVCPPIRGHGNLILAMQPFIAGWTLTRDLAPSGGRTRPIDMPPAKGRYHVF